MASRRKKSADALLLALACGASVESAARKVGVSERTVYRRLADPAVQQQLLALRADMVQRSTGMLTAAGLEAVKTLVDLLNGSQPAAVRLGAARTIVELGLKLRDATDLAERVTALEQQLPAAS
jgi:hypothetical protein